MIEITKYIRDYDAELQSFYQQLKSCVNGTLATDIRQPRYGLFIMIQHNNNGLVATFIDNCKWLLGNFYYGRLNQLTMYKNLVTLDFTTNTATKCEGQYQEHIEEAGVAMMQRLSTWRSAMWNEAWGLDITDGLGGSSSNSEE